MVPSRGPFFTRTTKRLLGSSTATSLGVCIASPGGGGVVERRTLPPVRPWRNTRGRNKAQALAIAAKVTEEPIQGPFPGLGLDCRTPECKSRAAAHRTSPYVQTRRYQGIFLRTRTGAPLALWMREGDSR